MNLVMENTLYTINLTKESEIQQTLSLVLLSVW